MGETQAWQDSNKHVRTNHPNEHIHIHHQTYTQRMFMWMHDLPRLPHCIIAPMALMHDHIYACSWYQNKKQRENPNLAC